MKFAGMWIGFSEDDARSIAAATDPPTRPSPRFRIRSLLDLFKTRIGVLNQSCALVNFSRIDWDGARNRLGARHQLPFKLHRFCAFDWKFPVMPEFVERVKHRLGFNWRSRRCNAWRSRTCGRNPATAVCLFPIRDIVQHGGIPISSFEGSAHDRPEVARDGRAIDKRSDRGDPDVALRIGITAIQSTASLSAHRDSTWSRARH